MTYQAMAERAMVITMHELIPAWRETGRPLAELRRIMGDVVALADGRARAPISSHALDFFAVARPRLDRSKPSDVAEFCRMICRALDTVGES